MIAGHSHSQQHSVSYDRIDAAYRCARSHNRRHSGLTVRDVLYSDSLATEIFLSLMLVSLGIVSVWMREPGAVVWLICLGTLRLYAIIRQHRRARVALAVVSLFTWFTMLYYSVATAPQFAVVFLVFALQSFWVFMRMPLDEPRAKTDRTGEGE